MKAEVRFIPNDKAVVRPDIKGTVALKRVEDEPARRPRRKARRRAGARGRAAPAETGPETACAAPTVPGVEHPTEPGPEQEEALE